MGSDDSNMKHKLGDIELLRTFALKHKDTCDLKVFVAAINARGAILRNLQPNEKVSFEDDGFTQISSKSETKTKVDFSKMSEDDRKTLLRAEEILTQAEIAVDR